MPTGAFFRITTPTMNILQYLKETKAELKEVIFPSSSQTIIYTMLVVLISVFIALTLSGMDLGLRTLLTKLIVR
jgi:preprotein translocase SecE subunit